MFTLAQISRGTRTHCASLLLTAAMALLMAGCGSTKVYTTEKTMVYKGNLYNLSQVQQIGSRVDLALPSGEAVDTNTLDKKRFQSLVKEHKTLTLSTVLLLDANEVVYERSQIDSYSDYTKHLKRFDKAKKEIADFMSDAKATQLKLD